MFSGHLKSEDFFVFQKIFQKIRVFGHIFEILQEVLNQVLAKPYEELGRWFLASEN